jgi:hypothetical protein
MSGMAAALLAFAPSALAVPTPIAAARVIIDFKGKHGRDPGTLASRLEGNCVPVRALAGWSVDFDGIDGTWAGGPLRTTGSLDVAARRGAVASTAGGLRFETQFRRPGDGRPGSLRMTHVGVELAGRRAYMTARLSPSPRQRRVGLVLRLGGRATTVANLAVAYAADARSDSFPSRTLSATIDGAPITFATATAGEPDLDTTPAALAAVGAALGTPVQGGLFPGEPSFTTVGPP